jgi:tRNA-dihydrouridine synthase
MQGVTTALFRSVFARHFGGIDRALSPFIPAVHGKLPPRRYFRDILPENNAGSIPLVPQLIGKDGAEFRETANRIADDLGYEEVNWNIGCPSPTVTTRGRGSGILPHPDRLDAFLDAACSGLRCRLSVKMRLGLERDDEWEALVDVLHRYPLCEVTMHPRTGRQQYGGRADVERFAAFYGRMRLPVAYNGDVRTTAFALDLCARFPGLSSLMIGRGLFVNPWLPSAVRGGWDERRDFDLAALRRFHDDLYRTYREAMEGGPGPVLAKMKELWALWGDASPGVKRVLKTRGFEDYEACVAAAFGPL